VNLWLQQLLSTRIDPEIKERAARVLEKSGLTVSDAVRMLLTRTANEGSLPFAPTTEPAGYDAWFRAEVQETLDDTHPGIPHQEVGTEFAALRAATLARMQAKDG
jgi:DNA-damage-inducible protein J